MRRRLLRSALVLEAASEPKADECACCRRLRGSSAYCPACLRHQRIYMGAFVVVALVSIFVASSAAEWAFSWFPYVPPWAHMTLAFVLCLGVPLLAQIVLALVPSQPEHGHWGPATESRRNGYGRYRAIFRNRAHGERIAKEQGLEARDLLEPRIGWTAIFLLCFLVPGVTAGLSFFSHDKRHVTLYVDNAGPGDVTIAVADGPVLGVADARRAKRFRIPMVAQRLVAMRDGRDIETLEIGGLDEVLAGRYSALFPDVEYDVADSFLWNLEQTTCYQESVQMYGSFGYSDPPEVHNKKAFVVTSEVPFTEAPTSIDSYMGVGSRRELLRVPCE